MLIRSAFSANIKERRDCSTALFDERGRMIAQAEHIPVHLGAMPDAVAAVKAHDPEPGEVWILNDPFAGGTHLPDVTMVSRTPLGYAVSRAHHADVGAVEPGSMPAESRTLAEEGVVIPPTPLDGRRARGADRADAEPGRAPRRLPRAARGAPPGRAAAGRALRAPRSRSRCAAAMDELYAYSERVVRAAIARAPGRPLRGGRRARGGRRGAARCTRPSRSPATRSRSTSPAPRRSTAATSTARSRSRARLRTSSSAA